MAKNSRNVYVDRAREYAMHLGSMDAVHPADRHLIETWSDHIRGKILDAGCGPGHWTAHLDQRGCTVEGIDQVPEFIDHAQTTYPGVAFDIGSMENLKLGTGSICGVLCWYSLIHHTAQKPFISRFKN